MIVLPSSDVVMSWIKGTYAEPGVAMATRAIIKRDWRFVSIQSKGDRTEGSIKKNTMSFRTSKVLPSCTLSSVSFRSLRFTRKREGDYPSRLATVPRSCRKGLLIALNQSILNSGRHLSLLSSPLTLFSESAQLPSSPLFHSVFALPSKTCWLDRQHVAIRS